MGASWRQRALPTVPVASGDLIEVLGFTRAGAVLALDVAGSSYLLYHLPAGAST
jgi:hypothetical protein